MDEFYSASALRSRAFVSMVEKVCFLSISSMVTIRRSVMRHLTFCKKCWILKAAACLVKILSEIFY